ncbi:MAG: hypothetical protein IJK13_05155 [Lachnospiraceae bacterium]|nr:hypothetical protein [Lachnospiraceae bacterium]
MTKNDNNKMEKIMAASKEIVNQMNDLGQEAYYEYLGPVEKLCDNENASETARLLEMQGGNIII